MDTMESMAVDLDTWIPDTWWGTHTWWEARIHGVEPTFMVAWPASQPALVGGQVGGPGGRAGPARDPRLPGRQATMYVGSTPCMWAPHHVWVPTMYQVSRYPGPPPWIPWYPWNRLVYLD